MTGSNCNAFLDARLTGDPGEFIVIRSLPGRAALLAGLLATL
ncbi:MAG: hypothetical protein ACRD5F_12965 [Candidatus Acidiferrales bacterium]